MYALEREERLVLAIAETIRQEKDQWQLASLRTQNALQPVSRLPDELLGEVFLLLAEDERELRRDRTLSGLLGVCHRWRRVALRQGSVWSEIIITVSAKKRALADAYLSRSGSSPIHMTINFDNPHFNDEIGRDVLENMIIPHASRCNSFKITFPSQTSYFLPIPVPTPDLQTLAITWLGGSIEPIPRAISQPHASDVLLTRLHLHHSINPGLADVVENLSMQALKYLVIDGGHDNAVIALIRRAPSLVKLSWKASPPRVPFSYTPHPVIELLSLTVVQLSGPLPYAVFTDCIRAPLLEAMDISVPDPRAHGEATAPRLIPGSLRFPALKSARLSPAFILNPTQLTAFLVKHPTLETFYLDKIIDNRAGVDLLAALEDIRRPSRNLRHIILGFTPAIRQNVWIESQSSGVGAFSQAFARILTRRRGAVSTNVDIPETCVTIKAPEPGSIRLEREPDLHPLLKFLFFNPEATTFSNDLFAI